MLGRWSARGSRTAAKTILVLAAVGCCLAAAAYAATRSARLDQGRTIHRPLKPRFIVMPPATSDERSAELAFVQPSRPAGRAKPGYPLGFECRLDGRIWDPCRSPVVLRRLSVGPHHFDVRANAFDRSGPSTRASWRVTRRPRDPEAGAPRPEPIPAPAPEGGAPPVSPVIVPLEPNEETIPEGDHLAIEADTSALEPLLPGAPVQPLPLTVVNPNPEPVYVTSLRVTASTEVEGCDAEENFELGAAGTSAATPLQVPAEGSASLPAPGIAAPTIAMRNLPFSQDACQDAEVDLLFEAEGNG